MAKLVSIYALFDPAAPAQIRYVGKSINPTQRLTRHISAAKTGKTPLARWIRSVLKAGRRPSVKVVSRCTPLCWEETELAFIRLYLTNGHKLCNVAGGGKANYVAKRRAMTAALAARRTHSQPRKS